MPRRCRFTEEEIAHARTLMAQARSAGEVKRALTVLLPVAYRAGNQQVATVLGLGRATVSRYQQDLRRVTRGDPRCRGAHGGRRRQTLSVAAEAGFLARYTAAASRGGLVAVPPLHAALEQQVGHPVAVSTTYRILARQGWRKLQPRPQHPKADPAQQAALKKTSRRSWQPPKRTIANTSRSG